MNLIVFLEEKIELFEELGVNLKKKRNNNNLRFVLFSCELICNTTVTLDEMAQGKDPPVLFLFFEM